MKLIVHIGDGKCGSVAIQAALHVRRHRLLRERKVYETGSARKDHFLIATMLGNPTRSRLSARSQIDYARANLREVAKLSRDADLIILSAESLFVNDTPPGAILDLLRTELRPEDPVSVVAYVRPPCDKYSSLLQQEIKGTHLFTPPDLYARPIDDRIVAWQEALAPEAPEIRVFDPARLGGG